jgi:chromosome segregation ATPase
MATQSLMHASVWQIEIRRGDIRLVQKIKDVFVSLSNAQQACKNLSSDRVELLKLVNLVEPAAIELVAWLHMVSDAKGRHIHDLEDAVVAQAQRGDANAARCKDLHEQLLDLRGQLAEATQRRDASEARCKDLEVQLQDLRGQLAEKRGDANAARCKDLEGQLQGLQGQLAEQRAALERAAAAQQKLTEEAAKARDAERRAATRCQELEGQLQNLQGQPAEQRAALERAAAAQQKLKEEAEKARDAERRAANLQVELERQVRRGDAIETRCKDLEGQLQRARDAVTRTPASEKGSEKVSEPAATAKRKPTAEAAKARDADTECDVIILL